MKNRAAIGLTAVLALPFGFPREGFGVVGRIQRIAPGEGGFVGRTATVGFGCALASIGDLDGDGISELAVGAERQSVVFDSVGAVWILFLRPDGRVRAEEGISTNDGGFIRGLGDGDRFGCSIAALGDLDGDGIVDLAVGSEGDDDGSDDAGAIRILFLTSAGTVRAQRKISALEGGLPAGTLGTRDLFGASVAAMGDLDGDGTADVAVGAPDRSASGPDGFVLVLLLHPDGTVKSSARIDADVLGLTTSTGKFAESIAPVGDLDGDGRPELAIGTTFAGTAGAIQIVSLSPALEILSLRTIDNENGFGGAASGQDVIGEFCTALGDLEGNGSFELCTGSGPTPWIVSVPPAGNTTAFRLESGIIDIAAPPTAGMLGDLDADGAMDFVLGDPSDPAGGAIYVCFRCTSVAATATRNPGGTNPASLTVTTPELGATVEATVDLATTGHGVTTILGYAGALTATLGGGQVLLMDVSHPSGELLHLPLRSGPLATYSVQVPRQLALCGVRVSAQALHLFRVQPYALSNAVDLTLGPAGTAP